MLMDMDMGCRYGLSKVLGWGPKQAVSSEIGYRCDHRMLRKVIKIGPIVFYKASGFALLNQRST